MLGCLLKSSIDLRKRLAAHVVVVGGGAMIPGMCHRLHHELVARVELDGAGDSAADAAAAQGEGEAAAWPTPEALTQGGGDRSTAAAPEHGYSALRPCISSSLWIPEQPFARNMLEWVGASIMASSTPPPAAAAVGASSLASVSAPMGHGAMDMTITPRQYTEAGGAPELPDWLSSPAQRPILLVWFGHAFEAIEGERWEKKGGSVVWTRVRG